jgi:hypothetical protein
MAAKKSTTTPIIDDESKLNFTLPMHTHKCTPAWNVNKSFGRLNVQFDDEDMNTTEDMGVITDFAFHQSIKLKPHVEGTKKGKTEKKMTNVMMFKTLLQGHPWEVYVDVDASSSLIPGGLSSVEKEVPQSTKKFNGVLSFPFFSSFL